MGDIGNPFEEKRETSIGEYKILFSQYVGMLATIMNFNQAEREALDTIIDSALTHEPEAVGILVKAAIKRGYLK